MKITLLEIATILKSKNSVLHGDKNKIIEGLSFDSRKCKEGILFVALKGEKRDGHDFIDSLAGSGAAVLCERLPENCNVDAIVVDSVLLSLGQLAAWYKEFKCNLEKTIAITGSVGKTTTKEFTFCVMSKKYKTHKTNGNYNNNIGLPLTILDIADEDKALILEMGMNNFGEIEKLSEIARPDIAMITNIGTSHIEMLGSRENICKAKCEILSGLRDGGTIILNGDEPLLREACKSFKDKCAHCDYKVIFVGLNDNNDIRATNINVNGGTEFDITSEGKLYHAILGIVGEHNVYNALFAYAAGKACGIEENKIIDALSEYKSVGMRQNIVEKDGIKVIADCYNASPESMCAALKVLCGKTFENARKIAVLGEMRELGFESKSLHKFVGKTIAAEKPDLVFTMGDMAKNIQYGAVENGYPIEKCKNYNDKDELLLSLSNTINSGDVVLFKASRIVKMEDIINRLGFEI